MAILLKPKKKILLVTHVHAHTAGAGAIADDDDDDGDDEDDVFTDRESNWKIHCRLMAVGDGDAAPSLYHMPCLTD